MKVLKCGTKAKFGEIEGTICSIEISYSNVVYKFAYFDLDLNYKTLWVSEEELILNMPKKQMIGFKNK